MQKPVVVVHGGAGVWQQDRRKAGITGIKQATKAGFKVLKADGHALDAVEVAVAFMEDDEAFNAGRGSTLTIDKRIEMEASIMDGGTLKAGAVGLLEDVKNPVRLARVVMEKTDHVFVVGKGAERLAELFGLERSNPLTDMRLLLWQELTRRLKEGETGSLPKLRKLVASHPSLLEMDTVGAVALDKEGNMAAATSTGGFSLKLPGRIGDSPLIGCGTYADNEAGACSATGIGEVAIKLVLAKNVCDLMRNGQSAQEAVENSLLQVNRRLSIKSSMGLISVDVQGRIGIAHDTPKLCWAYMTPETTQPRWGMMANSISNVTWESDGL